MAQAQIIAIVLFDHLPQLHTGQRLEAEAAIKHQTRAQSGTGNLETGGRHTNNP